MTQDAGLIPFLHDAVSWGFLPMPQSYFPILWMGTTRMSQALNSECASTLPLSTHEDTAGLTCPPSPLPSLAFYL